jgi:two-component system sensor histidine kinase BaeS
MKLSIAQKLVGAFLGLTLLVLTATLGLARWSFEQGFLDYVNALEQTRLERVQVDLADEYFSAGGNWQSMSEQRFSALMRLSMPREPFGGPPPNAKPTSERGPRPQRRGGQQFPPTALYDVDDNFVAGALLGIDGSLAIRVPIVADGNIVGELRTEPRRHISSPLETDFSRQQLTTSWILGISSLILAFGVSLLLARGLLAPMRRMIKNVAQLSSGDYSHRMNERRSDELGQLTRDLDRLGGTLEANQSARKRLLADVSHELRTPLTVLCGEIEALKDGLREFDETQLDSLDQEVQRLRYLVDDLYELSISDMGGLRYRFATVDLTDCLQKAIDGMRKRAAALGIELALAPPGASSAGVAVTVEADAQRMDQLLQNLLENSLAYTDALGRVTVTLSQTAATAIITIDDSPPGVKESDCEKLFDPLFRQEASRSRRTGGAGLGLAICRNIVIAHGGSISASPSALGGLSIQIEIPLSGESIK